VNSNSSTQQVVAELIGKKTYHPLISLRMGEHRADGRDGTPIVKGFAIYRKSLQIIPSGPYTLRFAVDGTKQEYTVRVANKTLVRTNDEDRQAA
jgi:hypothetical protein